MFPVRQRGRDEKRVKTAMNCGIGKKQKSLIGKLKKVLDEMLTILYNTSRCVDGLSPNGKATDSDSVIFKVRILVAQFVKSWSRRRFA